MAMLRHNRAYRFLRASFVIFMAVMRYEWLLVRRRLPLVKPSGKRWDRAHAKTARAIYGLAVGLGGGFVKLGQVLGARADFFPESFLAPLRGLHDRVPPRSFASLRRHVEAELGRPVEEVFAHVDEEPLAAASIAQVHRARLDTGDEAVIKIQYPEARTIFPTDLASLRRAVRWAHRLQRKIDLRPLVKELSEFICMELDFGREASSTERVRDNLAGHEFATVPRVHAELCTDRILVLEYCEGIALTDVDAIIASGVEPRLLAERIASVYCTMIFEHGFFHGDPHPGNLLVRPDGTFSLIDFGLAKELPEGFAAGVAGMIVAAMSGDGERAVASAESIGFVLRGRDPAPFVELVKKLLGDYGGAGRFIEVLRASSFEQIPTHFVLIVRALILLNGLSHLLVPRERVIPRAMAASLAPYVLAQGAAASKEAAASSTRT